MAEIKIYKEVAVLPAKLEANAIYLVRVGTGFDLYAVDSTGSKAHKLNPETVTVDEKNLFANSNMRIDAIGVNFTFLSATEFTYTTTTGNSVRIPNMDTLRSPLVTGEKYTFSCLTGRNTSKVSINFANDTGMIDLVATSVGDYYVWTGTFTCGSKLTIAPTMYIDGTNGKVYRFRLEKGISTTIINEVWALQAEIESLKGIIAKGGVTQGIGISEHGIVPPTGTGSNSFTINYKKSYTNIPTTLVLQHDPVGQQNRLVYPIGITNAGFTLRSNYALANQQLHYIVISND